jgi:hypothetical protein
MTRKKAGCHKKRFDERGARIAIETNKHSSSNNRMEIRYYWCHYCSAYHLTSKPKKNDIR